MKITISYEDYLDETNDPAIRRTEARVCKREGPRYVDHKLGLDMRIPYSGYKHGGIEFILIGFGRLDTKPRMHPSAEATKALKTFLGHGYMHLGDATLRGIYYLERDGKFGEMMALAAEKKEELGRVKAVTMAILTVTAGGKKTPKESEDMGFSY